MFKKFFLLTSLVISGSVSSFAAALPGETMANDTLIQDTLPSVYMTASAFVPDCEDFAVTDTRVLQPPHDLKMQNGRYVAGQWQEAWTVQACRRQVIVPIDFILDPTGAAFAINVKNIQQQ